MNQLHGCSILFVNSADQILLLLRDNIPNLPYPGMWDLPGGHVEPHETPAQCIVREMKEEMGLTLSGHQLFEVTAYPDRIEHTFWLRIDFDVAAIELTEGQCIRWFAKQETLDLELAYGFSPVVHRFFAQRPFDTH